MFAFAISVLILFGPAPYQFTVNSVVPYPDEESCQQAIEVTGKIIQAGLPPGSRIRVEGTCFKGDSVEG